MKKTYSLKKFLKSKLLPSAFILCTAFSYNAKAQRIFDNNSLTFKSNISTGGSGPNFIVSDDLNLDGKPDIVVTNTGSNPPTTTGVSIFTNTTTSIGNISLALTSTLAAGTGAFGVATADLDGDNLPEIIVANGADANISIYKNTSTISGPISFGARQNFSVGSGPFYVATGDLNADGQVDIVVVNRNGANISLLRNTSTSSVFSFITTAAITGINNSLPNSVAIKDLDNDGKPDLAVANGNISTFSILRNLSTPGGAIALDGYFDLPTGVQPSSMKITDIDGDSKNDLVFSSADNVSILRNRTGVIGTTMFDTEVNGFISSGFGLQVEDLDGDNKPDLISTQPLSGTFFISRNKSQSGIININNSFTAQVTFSPGQGRTFGTAITDLDSDGKPDVVIVNETNSNISVYRNTIDVTAPVTPTNLTVKPGSTQNVLKWDANTETDLASYKIYGGTTPNPTTSLGVISAPTTTFTHTGLTNGTPYYYRITALDNVGNESVYSTEISATPQFPPVIAGFSPNAAPIGDPIIISGANFNSNAAKNIVFFGSVRATVMTASNNTLVVNAPAGASNQPITVLNTDTELIGSSADFFKTTFDNATGKPFDANSFKAELTFPTTATKSSVNAKMGDFNGDGKNDIVVGYSNGGANVLSIYQNTAATGDLNGSSFSKLPDLQTNETNYVPRSIAIGDLDGDGKLDIVAADANGSGALKIFLNTSTLSTVSFAPVKTFTNATGAFIYDIEIADIDGDGKNDIVGTRFNNSSNIYITRNTTSAIGDISLAPSPAVFTTSGGSNTVAVKDLDADGKPEILSANTFGNELTILYNKSTPGVINAGSFRTPTSTDILTLNASTNSIAVANLDGDAKPEIIVSYPTINTTNNISILQNSSVSGTWNFTKQDFSVASAPNHIEISDLDGDGQSDIIAVANAGNSAFLLRNLTTPGGAIALAAPFQKTTSAGANFIGAGDLDNDSKADLFFANGANLKVLKNYIDATAPSAPSNLAVASGGLQNTLNWTANTEPDLASYNIYAGTNPNPTTVVGTVTIVPPATSPATTFTHTNLTAGTTYYYRIAAVDQSGNEGSKSNEVSATTSAAPVITNVSATSGAVGTSLTLTGLNFNATATNNTVYFGGVKATVTAASTTQLTVTVPVGATNQTISVLNTTTGLAGISAQPFRVTFNNAVGKTFGRNFILEEATKFSAGSGYPYQVYDLDGDGKNDLLLNTNSALEIYLNTSAPGGEILVNNNKFTLATAQIRGMEVGDLNGDGKLDVVLTDYTTNRIRIFINNTTIVGNLAFTEATPIAITSPDYLALADIDGDGKLDIVLGRTNSASIGIYKNITSTTTNTQFDNVPVLVIANNNLRGLNVTDIDGDGKPELIAPESSFLSIFKNNNTAGTINAASFTLDRRSLQAASVYMTVADIDSDGKTDIAYHISTSNVYVLHNTTTAGTLNFAAQTIALPSASYRFNFGDVDGDGKLDLFVPGPNGVYALRNNGSAGNISFENPFLAISAYQPAHVFFADVNNDGKSDLFVGDGGDSRLYRNNIDIAAPNAPTNLVATAGGLQNTLTWTANSETDLDGYKVYGGTTANPTTLLTTITAIAPATTPANTYIHTGLTSGSTYYYRIVAFDRTDNKSGYSNEVSSYIKLPQTITFNAINPVVFGTADFNPGATSTNTTIAITYASSNTNVATIVNGQIHVIGVGTTTITASQAGDNTYSAAANVTQQLTVTQASQTITFNTINPVVFGSANFNAGATSTNTTIPITYTSSDLNVAKIINNNQIQIVGVGTTIITANQIGNTNYSAAASVSQQLTVTKAMQTITFNSIPDQVLGNPDYTLNATASSGLTLSYTSDNTNVVTIVNGKLHTVGSGTANITATQAGDQNYLAATPIVQSVRVINDPKVVPNNIITPNGDGNNDTWDIKNIAEYPDNEVTILDRAGRTVYHKKGYNNDWDGNYNGNPLEENTYYYILKLGSNKAPIKGFITLIRNNK